MYDQFYGFTGRPFQLTPDPSFYFESGTHRKAMSYLGYGLAQGEGFIVITGDIGAGKTTLVGHLMNTIDPNRLTAVKLVSTQVEGDDLLRLVAEQFGIEWEGQSKAELLRSMEQYLREQARAGRRTLLIVDEGQNLAISALEELRMLSNFQLGGHSLLQIFLLGQPEFRQTLFHTPTLEQLRQRVIATHHLDPMEPEEVEPYILHRLGKVGWTGNPSFSPDAFEEIFDYSEGVPRKLNVLVSRLLLFGAVEQLSRITAQHVREVIGEIEADRGLDQSALAAPVEEVARAFEAPVQAETALEWPVAEPEVRAGSRPPFAAPEAPEKPLDLSRARLGGAGDERRAGAPAVAEAPAAEEAGHSEPPVAAEEVAELKAQIADLEARLVEQDAALRRVLDLLIEWVERDPENAPNPTKSKVWAA
ncbi:XrtA/PEP-CTERM system-associated ATPase [Sphingopyxis indica]|uniref:Putative secretion ATPase, PEP-CTERM locus subfamily n=1 Tax=Sphingopyxis indica TaxID=436663 RepID=A0A239FLH4_9SPHN|nr:XrtA/PEP-CTERM system-associated ATPase [Sphingopyxis indica]SNS57093.1 putative secretion ATPase, PEP-CTERM locus subfamily [Sphingopyxis indica]